MGITFTILSFDVKTPVSIDLLIAMLSGDDMAYLIFLIILYAHYHVHCFLWIYYFCVVCGAKIEWCGMRACWHEVL